MNWSHDALAEDLATHIRGMTDRVVWTDMQLGPMHSPRPDVYSIPKTYQKLVPIAYEVKISVADFRRDVTSGKWQNYLKYAAGVVFAVPRGLVTKADIPAGCGLMTRGEDGWSTAKAPTLQRLETLPREAWMKLIFDGIVRQYRIDPRERNVRDRIVQDEVRRKYGAGIAAALSERDKAILYLRLEEDQHRREMEAARARHTEAMSRLIAKQDDDRRVIDRERHALCEMLGLPQGSSAWNIAHALAEVKKSLSADAEVQRARTEVTRAKNVLNNALRSLEIESALDKVTMPTGQEEDPCNA